MTDNEKLADLLFPDVTQTPDDLEKMYPQRSLAEGAAVTRFAPSPTGFLHIGGLFAALCAYLTAKDRNGIFYLRIEDTDKKREVENGVSGIISGLEAFGIVPDEGVTGENSEKGIYGPYTQSKRRNVYHIMAKYLTAAGFAYPCFCTEEQISKLREQQIKDGVNPGYYGKYAKCRSLSFEEIEKRINAGEQYVLRLRSPGDENKKITFTDQIKGKIEMPENILDIVLLKADGMPTYHFAHAVDDHFMRTTHVVRGDEWISSVPIHIQLFSCLNFRAPKYAHIAPVMKEDGGGKRKLSKRKDPEASVTFYSEQGYPKDSVLEYLYTLANSNFEDWRRANRQSPRSDFAFSFKKMSTSGALFDLLKLDDVSRNVISVMDTDTVFSQLMPWAQQYDETMYTLFENDPQYLKNILSIDRGIKKPRKDIAKWSDVKQYLSYFYDELFDGSFAIPENIRMDDAKDILRAYAAVYDENDEKDVWFEKMKSICAPLGFSPDVRAYKESPDDFKGHVGDVSEVVRIAVTGRANTPDLCAVMKLLGRQRVISRLERIYNER